MRTIIIINWLLSFFSLCIDTEQSPLWAVLACGAWFAVSSLLLRFVRVKDVLRGIVKIRRFWRSFWRPKFDFYAFNKRLEANINK
jgi:hypothetical protein